MGKRGLKAKRGPELEKRGPKLEKRGPGQMTEMALFGPKKAWALGQGLVGLEGNPPLVLSDLS